MAEPEPPELLFAKYGKLVIKPDRPEDWIASSQTAKAAAREVARTQSRLDTGKSLDVQNEPRGGAIVAVSASFPHHKQPRAKQAPALAQRPPRTAVLWGLAQPTDRLGVNSAVSLVEGSSEATFSLDGFIDLTKRTGLEWSLSSSPACKLSGEASASGTLPRLPVIGPITLRHTVTLATPSAPLRHTTAVSTRPFNGPGMVRLKVAEATGSQQLTLELGNQSGSSSASNGKAGGGGGPKLQRSSGTTSSTSTSAGSGYSSDSDSEGPANSGSNGGGGSKRPGWRIPALRVDIPPAAAAPRDLSYQWRQAWAAFTSTSLAYRAPSQQVCVEARQRLPALGLTLNGSAVLDERSRDVRRAALKLLCKVKPRGRGRAKHHLRLEAGWTAAPPAAAGAAAGVAAAGGSGGAAAGGGNGGPFAAMLAGSGSWVQGLRYRVGGRSSSAEQPRGFLELGVQMSGMQWRSVDLEYCLPLP